MKNLFIVLICLSFVACLKTRQDVAEAENRQEFQNQLTTLQKQKADETARFDEVESSLRQLNGRLEAIEYQFKQTQEGDEKQSLVAKVDSILEQMKIFEQENVTLKKRIAALESGRSTSRSSKKRSSWQKAESYLKKGDWAQALLGYKEYQEKNPRGRLWALANYKIGVCFQEMGKKDNAKLFFQETIEKHPKSEAAKRARYRLGKMK
jgi:TolA-binding protein